MSDSDALYLDAVDALEIALEQADDNRARELIREAIQLEVTEAKR